MNRTTAQMRPGTLSLLSLVAVMAMAALALLAWHSACVAYDTANRNADMAKEIATAEVTANQFVAAVGENMLGNPEYKEEDLTTLANSLGASSSQLVHESEGKTLVSAAFPAGQGRRLNVSISITGSKYEITGWELSGVPESAEPMGGIYTPSG